MSNIQSFIEGLDGLTQECQARLGQACSFMDLESLRVEFLGRKGKLAEAMSALAQMGPEDKPAAGRKANEVKTALSSMLEGRQAELEAASAKDALAGFDPSLPGRRPAQGSLHPVTLAMQEIVEVLTGLGFEVVAGPEVERDWYNFEALNMPPDHPARDMQDTLYVSENILLRTHTSPLQVRTMMSRKPPVAVIAPGKVYRRDSDITHTPMFHQIEGLLVDKNVSMADLRGTLTAFVRQLFSADTKVRFRPSFFPFTEPSAEVDISCMLCGGAGHIGPDPCRVCKRTGWVEILGCGMVRVAMLKYGIGDLRMFFENDVRFLEQFA